MYGELLTSMLMLAMGTLDAPIVEGVAVTQTMETYTVSGVTSRSPKKAGRRWLSRPSGARVKERGKVQFPVRPFGGTSEADSDIVERGA